MLALEITSYRSVSSQTSCDGNRNILKTFTGIRRVMFYWFATTKWTLPVSSFLPRENTIFRGKKSEKRKRLSYICSRLKSQKTLSVDNCLWGQALSSFSISKSLIITCDLHTAYSTVHFRNHHPLWPFHWIIFCSSLSLSLSLSCRKVWFCSHLKTDPVEFSRLVILELHTFVSHWSLMWNAN